MNQIRFVQHEAVLEGGILNSRAPGVGNNATDTITVSLTSYGSRIDTVHLTIESLMQQSLKADRIVLCLAKGEFSEKSLPASLKRQRERGLEVLFCEEDIKSYKKFFYTLQKYPDDITITVDDDLIYPIDTIDSLYRAYTLNPKSIHCNRAHLITLNKRGLPLPYKKWAPSNDKASLITFPTGVGGVLYFPGSLDDAVFDKSTFLKLAPNSDDVWLKAMSLRKFVKCCQVPSGRSFFNRAVEIPGSQAVALKRKNKCRASGNDLAISKVFEKYNINPILAGCV